MKVDINYILANEEYKPEVGCEYEVAPDKWGKLKYPTIKLQEAVFAKTEAGELDDFEVMKMVLGGLGDIEKADCIFGMPTRVVQDFFTLLSLIVGRLKSSSDSLNQSATQESPAKPA